MLAAGVILAIMIIPIISSITREVLMVVPQHQREAVLALGATRWEMIRIGVLRNARAGIVGGIILGLGRALGETMAVTMVIGNRPEIAKSLFAPGYTMASVLANEFSEATGDIYLVRLGGNRSGTILRHDNSECAGAIAGVDRNPRPACEGKCLRPHPSAPDAGAADQFAPARHRSRHDRRGGSDRRDRAGAVGGDLRLPLYRGIGSMNWAFLTQTPKPVGEAGGGMANAIVGIGLDPRHRQPDRRSIRHRRRDLSGGVWPQSLRKA